MCVRVCVCVWDSKIEIKWVPLNFYMLEHICWEIIGLQVYPCANTLNYPRQVFKDHKVSKLSCTLFMLKAFKCFKMAFLSDFYSVLFHAFQSLRDFYSYMTWNLLHCHDKKKRFYRILPVYFIWTYFTLMWLLRFFLSGPNYWYNNQIVHQCTPVSLHLWGWLSGKCQTPWQKKKGF